MLQTKHMEDMQAHIAAHKAALEGVKSEAEITRRAELEGEKQQHLKDIGKDWFVMLYT